MLLAAAPVATGTGNAAIWVAAIGALSLVVGALIPELFKLVKAKPPEVPAGTAVTAADLQGLRQEMAGLTATVGKVDGEMRGVRREQKAMREALDARDRQHARDVEDVRDEVQRHLWGDHGFGARRRERGPDSGPIPVPRPEPV